MFSFDHVNFLIVILNSTTFVLIHLILIGLTHHLPLIIYEKARKTISYKYSSLM